MKILVTGGTGFLGEYLVPLLCARYEKVFLLTRGLNKKKFSNLSNIIWVEGDLTDVHVLSAGAEIINEIYSEVDTVLHAGALYDLEASYARCFLNNVVATQNVLNLLKKMKGLKEFFYISTIAVGDPMSESYTTLHENELPRRKKFNDHYSETKYTAETLVRTHSIEGVKTRIIRPGIIVGSSQNASMPKVDGPYYFIEAFKKIKEVLKYLPVLPLSFNPTSLIPIIPVDHCAQFIDLLIKRDSCADSLRTYHLVSYETPNIERFLADLNKHFQLKTKYIPFKENPLHQKILVQLGIPKEVISFMLSKINYDMSLTLELVPEIKESKYSIYKNIFFR